LFTLKGHDFSRADKINRINRALAPEGRLSGFSSWNRPFSAACSAPEGRFLDLPFEARLKPKELCSVPMSYKAPPVWMPRRNFSIGFPDPLSLGTGKLEGLIACAKH
jgi:hypothetical protein